MSLGHEELKHKIRYTILLVVAPLYFAFYDSLSSAYSHSESVSDAHTGVKADDSGICELDTSLLEEDSDSSLLVSMMDH